MRSWAWLPIAALLLGAPGCDSEAKSSAPPVPSTSDPEGEDLVEGAIVAAVEDSGGVRLYKITEVNWFPKPVGKELVMLAFQEKGNDFTHAAKLYGQRDLTVALPGVRVQIQNFMKRDHRVLDVEPVREAELALERGDALPPRLSPGEAKAAKAASDGEPAKD